MCLCISEQSPMVYVTLASEFPQFTRPYGVFDGCSQAVVAMTRADRVHQRARRSLRDPRRNFLGPPAQRIFYLGPRWSEP